jgi:transcriptional regulator with AAA-type ATPase domain
VTEDKSETLRELLRDGVAEELAPQPYLFLVLECERPEAGGARYSLRDVREVRLGRGESRGSSRKDSTATLQLEVRDRWMSSAHGRMFRIQGSWIFEDLASTNGSTLDGAVVKTSPLRDGAILTLGHTVFIYREAVPTPPGCAPDADLSDLISKPVAFASLLPGYAWELSMLERMAQSELSILLLGETGTGKELLARAIHATSGRSGALVAVNCGALPETLVESQFFGHEKGAFSGAHRDAPGFVRSADKGTLFLDEVGDLRGPSQAALLRVLQEREVVPVGSVKAQKVDIRVVSATHRPIDALVTSDSFRGDLLARLAGFRHVVPPLRQRREDLGHLYATMMRERRQAGQPLPLLTPESARTLLTYDWPGNIRELKHVVEAGAVLSEGQGLRLSDLPPAMRSRTAALTAPSPPTFTDQSRAELRERLVASLEAHSGNVTAVAEAMRTSRTQVYRWLKRFSIDVSQFVRPRG